MILHVTAIAESLGHVRMLFDPHLAMNLRYSSCNWLSRLFFVVVLALDEYCSGVLGLLEA